MKKIWSIREVDKVIPKRYPNGREIPPEIRREIYAYYLLEKKLSKLKKLGSIKRVGTVVPRKRRKLRKVV